MEFKAYTVEDFLSKDETYVLVNAAISITEEQWNSENTHPFWQGRVIHLPQLSLVSKPAYSLISHEIFPRIRKKLVSQYDLDLPTFPDSIDLVRWPVGLSQPTHWDDMKGLGEENSWNSHRKYGVIIYLNDDYEGGQTYYPKFNHYITPKAGMLAVHPGDEIHEHGVTAIKKTIRYTLSSFWHHTPSKVVIPEFHDEYYNSNKDLIKVD